MFERALTPQDIHDRYHVLNGAIYGLASHGRFLGAFKPSNRSPDLAGLYLAGRRRPPGAGHADGAHERLDRCGCGRERWAAEARPIKRRARRCSAGLRRGMNGNVERLSLSARSPLQTERGRTTDPFREDAAGAGEAPFVSLFTAPVVYQLLPVVHGASFPLAAPGAVRACSRRQRRLACPLLQSFILVGSDRSAAPARRALSGMPAVRTHGCDRARPVWRSSGASGFSELNRARSEAPDSSCVPRNWFCGARGQFSRLRLKDVLRTRGSARSGCSRVGPLGVPCAFGDVCAGGDRVCVLGGKAAGNPGAFRAWPAAGNERCGGTGGRLDHSFRGRPARHAGRSCRRIPGTLPCRFQRSLARRGRAGGRLRSLAGIRGLVAWRAICPATRNEMISPLIWLVLILAAVPALLFFVNLFAYRRLARAPGPLASDDRVSVLIPARNEALNIRAAVESALANRGVELQVIVLDDHSNDRTADIVAELATRDSRVRIGVRPGAACWLVRKAARVLSLGRADRRPLAGLR